MTTATTSHDDRLIVLSITNHEKREGLFKHTDDPVNADGIVSRTASKRVMTVGMFNKLQPHVDTHKTVRVSLLGQVDDDEDDYSVIVANASPASYEYNEILRRIRF